MYPIRNILFRTFLVGVFLAPIMASAQATTTASGDDDLQKIIQEQIELIKQEHVSSLPSTSEISQKLLLNNLSVQVSPTNPGPNEDIRVTIESYMSNLDTAMISWSLNGKVSLKGMGKRTFSFTNGPSNKTTYLSAHITTNAGESITKEFSWRPIGLTVLWQASTYTPPFYRGKALITPQARVTTTAIPDNTNSNNALSTGNFDYLWQKDNVSVPAASGYGRNSFSFPAPKPFGKSSVKVLVTSIDGFTTTEKKIALPMSDPFILFYEDSPLLGVWYNRPIGSNFTLTKKEISISAEPYFFSDDDSASSILKYNWTINGGSTNTSNRHITLRNDTGVKGDSIVSLNMSGMRKIFQEASRSIVVRFNNNEDLGGNTLF